MILNNHTVDSTQQFHSDTDLDPMGPYTQAIEVEKIIFISGQIPIIPDTKTMPDNIYDQTYQSLQNIRNILNLKNLQIKNIVKTTIFIIDMDDLDIINISYKNFFDLYLNDKHMHLPARSCVEVSKLPKRAKIEIEAIAMRF